MKLSSTETKILNRCFRTAQQAAFEAGDFLSAKYGRFRSLSEKPDAGLVTEADRGAEKRAIGVIRKAFPDHGFLAEETGAHASKTTGHSFRWIIDPLDGTTNFVHGFPIFCVSIGLEYQGELVLGVIYQPMTKDLYTGRLGQGAFRNGKRLKVSKTADLKGSMLTTGFSYRSDDVFEKELRTFEDILHRARAIRRTGSAALDLCFVATGWFDGFFERNLSPWDVAAGLVILREAGGQDSDFRGQPYRFGSETLIATNGKIHRVLLAAISR